MNTPPDRLTLTQITRSMRMFRPGERSWNERASAHITNFLEHNRIAAREEHAELALLNCAELIWELCPTEPRWSALCVDTLFRRLRVQHDFFPQPGLVVTHYDLLHLFLPWLARQHLIAKDTCERLVSELLALKTPFVDEARHQLRLREAAHRRQGTWHEVLKTMEW